MITSSASAIASKRLTTARRPLVPIRVSASANSKANRTSGRTAPLAAAATTIDSMKTQKQSRMRGSANVRRNDADEEIHDARQRLRPFVFDTGQAPLQPFSGFPREGENMGQ